MKCCAERLIADIAERTFVAMFITWPALVFAADMTTDEKMTVTAAVMGATMGKGLVASLVGDRCSAALLPHHDCEARCDDSRQL